MAATKPHMATEHMKGGSSGLRCAVSIKDKPDFEDLVQGMNI